MDIHKLRNLIFERLVDPIAKLGCAGPPECKTCPGGDYSTGLATFGDVIEVEIDDQRYEIRVEDITGKVIK